MRLLADYGSLTRWLNSELTEGVLTALEAQVIAGSGTGENMTGVLTVAGSTTVAFATDVVTTLRKGLTALQNLGVQPNAWVLNPADAEAVDLTKEGTGGIGFLTDGYTTGNALSGNIFGDPNIQRVVSPSVPAGTAILGDWSKIGLWVREGVRVDIGFPDDTFKKNQAVLRGEMRVGAGVLMPPSFAVIDLTA
ncbi:phage major capsid protein [Mycolicibacterium sp. 120270]|nr:phage major capsid protein [Mycolicibacterium sp. 120270]MDX1885821.1 phage major capsid protein [Mycolicibacterium sp. 120270]